MFIIQIIKSLNQGMQAKMLSMQIVVIMLFVSDCTDHLFWILSNSWLIWKQNCETQPPASMGWVALSSVVRLSRISDISSHLHYMMLQSIQTIYFLWGYDPGNMSVSNISSVAELSPVYCCLVIFLCHCGNWCRSFPSVDRPTQLIFIGLVFVSLSSADVNIQAQPVYDI